MKEIIEYFQLYIDKLESMKYQKSLLQIFVHPKIKKKRLILFLFFIFLKQTKVNCKATAPQTEAYNNALVDLMSVKRCDDNKINLFTTLLQL